MWHTLNFFDYVLAGIIGIFIITFISKRFHNFLVLLNVKKNLSSIKIIEIKDMLQCRQACRNLRAHCEDLSALGFDCEWVSEKGKQKPVALLQLASVHGLCCLFRLNILGIVQKELEELLNDSNIIKLGISPLNDARLLRQDYNVQVSSTLDLRYLYPTGGGLAAMSASEIGVELDKSWWLKCSNWEAPTLTNAQKDYAAKDAYVAIEIFRKWLLTNNESFNFSKVNYVSLLNQHFLQLARYFDVNFKPKGCFNPSVTSNKQTNTYTPEGLTPKKPRSDYVTRKSPLYHNCFMHAPDGELLCSCDKRKAQWYVDRGLAEVLPGEPYSIRLLFEPAARAGKTDGGRFYQQLKQNCCVVCGALDSYLKHNVVPKEYRKHFPNIMKDHQSHDIVLMCVRCHHLAAQHNEKLRLQLSAICNAPIVTQVYHNKPLLQLKNYAKALLKAGDVIPEGRKNFLENEIKRHYGLKTLTQKFLLEVADLESLAIKTNYEAHGVRVVKYFIENEGGLKKLEILWRTHFLNTMKPQYLPALWSVTHNHSRLSPEADAEYV